MMVEQFIDRLAQQGLLDKRVIDELRRKVAKVQGKKVTPEAIAKYLIDRGHLTRFQATKLVNEFTSLPDTAGDRGAKSKSGELQLAPLEDPAGLRDSLQVPPAPGARQRPAVDEEVDDLTAIDRDWDQPAPAAPVPREPEAERRPRAVQPGPPAAPPGAPPSGPPAPPHPTARAVPLTDDLLAGLESHGAPVLMAGDRSGRHGLAPVQRRLQKTSEWDSMLLLVGGASIGVMLVIGAFLYLSLARGKAEELIAAAGKEYSAQSYAQAIRLYDEFLEAYPHHEDASLARVRREIARLRQSYKVPEQGLKVAREVLPIIEQEESFPTARDELASMLPQIAAGFVSEARRAGDATAQEELLQKTAAAMELVENPNYIPSELRKSQATTIDAIREDMARVRREIDRVRNLDATVETIAQAALSGDTPAAYAARQALLSTYPGLDADPQLRDAMLKISDRERQRVQVVEEPIAPATDDPAAALPPHIVLSHRAGQTIASVIDHVVYTLAEGNVFALDASTGDVLWRRFVGFETIWQPQPLAAATPGSDAVVVDQRSGEVMRLQARTGTLVWRVALGEAFFAPLVVGDHIYVAGASGKLYVIEADSGQVKHHVRIPQSLEVAAGVGVGRPQLYQVANQDNIYVLSAETLECREVLYLGHKRGTISVPPVMALGYLFVVENAGPDVSFLHVIATDSQGLNLKVAQEKIRLRGRVLVPPVVGRRQVLVVTDRRAVELFDVDPNNATGTPVTTLGRLNATAEEPMIGYPLLEVGYAWVANNRFSKYQLQATSGKLVSEWVLDEQDVYLAPLQLVRDVVIHVRRRQSAPGVSIAATRTGDKDPSWQTEVAVPARGVFVRDEAVDIVTARGRLFRAGAADFQHGLLSAAQASALRDERLVLSLAEGIEAGDGQWVFAPPQGYHQLVFYQPGAGQEPLRLLTLTVPAGAATCQPVPFAGGLLVPQQDGNVTLVDPVTGSDRMHAFHPSTPLGDTTRWSRPAVLDGGQEFVIATSYHALYRVGIHDVGGKALAELASRQVEGEVISPWAAVGSCCYGVLRSSAGDQVAGYALPDLTPASPVPLAGRLAWGPERVGDVVLVASEAELICMDGTLQQRWKTPLEHGPVVGRALRSDAHAWLCSADGFLCRIELADGNLVETVAIGEPLASGPVLYGDRLLVAGRSGVLWNVAVSSP